MKMVMRSDMSVFLSVDRSIIEQKVAVSRDFMDQDIVDEPSVLVQQSGVLRLPVLKARGIVGGDVVDQPQSLRAANLDLAHVADIEQADAPPYCVVLLQEARVLRGHAPAP